VLILHTAKVSFLEEVMELILEAVRLMKDHAHQKAVLIKIFIPWSFMKNQHLKNQHLNQLLKNQLLKNQLLKNQLLKNQLLKNQLPQDQLAITNSNLNIVTVRNGRN